MLHSGTNWSHRQSVVADATVVAPKADGSRVSALLQMNQDRPRRSGQRVQFDPAEYESWLLRNPIEYSLELHRVGA
jgi:hypothetical protein